MPDIQLSTHFKTFLNLLDNRQAEYLLVGGYAVQYYGYPRATRDLDLWTSTEPKNAAKLVEVCQVFTSGIAGLTTEPFEHPNRIIRIQVPPVRVEVLDPIIGRQPDVLQRFEGEKTAQIEFLTVQTGVSFAECYAERVVDFIDGVKVNIISLERLRAIKQAGDRPKDLDDLAHLDSF